VARRLQLQYVVFPPKREWVEFEDFKKRLAGVQSWSHPTSS
jgi:hypothetical protein